MTGLQIKSWRTNAGLTQAEAAERLGVASNTVARWERGELAVPSFVDGLVDQKRSETPASYVRAIMQEQGLSIRDVVRRSGNRLSNSSISNVLTGITRNPSLDFMLGLAKGLGRSPTEVFHAFCGESPDLSRDLELEAIQRSYALLPPVKRKQFQFVFRMLSREINRSLRE